MNLDRLKGVINDKGYVIFDDDSKPYNLNYGAIRDTGGQWNDMFFMFWNYHGKWSFIKWMGTTDPSPLYLKDPINTKGSAIMVEDQHRGLFKLGLHRRRYQALVPARPVGVHRIPKGFTYADIDKISELPIDVGMHGTNSHRAHTKIEMPKIGLYGAGCQVTLAYMEYLVAMGIWKPGLLNWGGTLTYTLLNRNDFK